MNNVKPGDYAAIWIPKHFGKRVEVIELANRETHQLYAANGKPGVVWTCEILQDTALGDPANGWMPTVFPAGTRSSWHDSNLRRINRPSVADETERYLAKHRETSEAA